MYRIIKDDKFEAKLVLKWIYDLEIEKLSELQNQ